MIRRHGNCDNKKSIRCVPYFSRYLAKAMFMTNLVPEVESESHVAPSADDKIQMVEAVSDDNLKKPVEETPGEKDYFAQVSLMWNIPNC